MSTRYVWAPYLADDQIAFRPPEESDAGQSVRWHESLLPLSHARALEQLRETETVPWGGAPNVRLIIADKENEEILGGVKLQREGPIFDWFEIVPSRLLPDARQREIAVRALRILTPWLFGEIGALSVRMHLPADHDHLIETAAELGYVRTATYRESLLRPHGFIDVHVYQRVSTEWNITRHQEPVANV